MLEKRTIGLNFRDQQEADFRVWAPFAEKVEIRTDGFTEPLDRKSMGFWEHKFLKIAPGTLYDILIDDRPFADPASLYQGDGINGRSMAFNLLAYKWNDKNWKGLQPEELIIYELHTGTFTEEGTFDGVAEKLKYLRDLGINAIEIMPVAQFSGERNWGYDGVFPFAVQNSYGGPERLQHLTDVCHQNGIAVILDVVMNHLGPEGNILPAFGPFFTDKYKTPWGSAVNFDDAWCDGVRMFYIQNVLMWLRDFHIDGIRLDAVHAIKDFSPKNILQEIREHVAELNQTSDCNHFIISECDLNDVRYITPVKNGGYGLDATWCDEFHHALHVLVTGENKGYYADFTGTRDLIKAFNEAFVFNGNWSEHRKKNFGTSTAGFAGHNFVVFSQNHDQTGNRMNGDRLSTLIDFEKLKLVAGAVLFSPCIPLLFMGEEYAERQPFQYFISPQGRELIRAVRKGRKSEFDSFISGGKPPDPQSEKTFRQSKLKWTGHSKAQRYIFEFYRELIRLRQTLPIWKNTDRKNFSAKNINNRHVVQLTRENRNEILLALLNFEDYPVPVITCETYISWQLILNSCDSKWGGSGGEIDISCPTVSVPPHAMIVLYSP
jgi:maltooligosyltrehalose trehalohydrolase